MRVSERIKDKRGAGGTFPSLRGHRLRKKAARLEKDEERTPDRSVEGEAEDGEGGDWQERTEGRGLLAEL